MPIKIPKGLGVAVGFVVIIGLVALLVWGYLSLAGGKTGSVSGTGQGIFGSLFPFGFSGPTTSTSTDTTVEGPSGPAPELRQVTDQEVAGSGFATGIDGTLAIRYMERNSGHIYETPANSLTLTRLTNTTIPAVHDARWIDASTTLMRFADDTDEPQNFVGFFASSTPDQQLEGSFLKKYVRVSIGAGGTILGVSVVPGGSVAETVLKDGTKPKTLITSPLASWVPVAGGNAYYLQSAPTGVARGSLYDISKSTLIPVVSGVVGLQTLPSPSGSQLLISGGQQNTLTLATVERTTKKITSLQRATLVGKCAWLPANDSRVLCAFPTTLPSGMYPDDWLLGRIHTSDDLWFIDVSTGVMTEAFSLTTSGSGPFDVSDVHVSPDGAYATFINRNDQTLWSATLRKTAQ